MKLKKKKGFTLIELLAVIVILTLIMLIVTPLILKMIQTARKEAFRASAYGIAKSAEFKTERNILEGELGDFISKYENNVLSEGEKLDFKGSKPKQGIVVASNGKVSLAITNGVWCARKGYNDTKITLTKYPEEDNCELEMDDVEWEIVDAEITVEGDAVIKLRTSNNDIKYLVSNELRDFGPFYWDNDDVFERFPVKFLDNKFLNQSDTSNNGVSIIKYYEGFMLTEDSLIDVNNNMVTVMENINIKDFSFDWHNYNLVVLFNDDNNSLKSYDCENYKFEGKIDNITEIFSGGYLTTGKDLILYDGTTIDENVDSLIGEINYWNYNHHGFDWGVLYVKKEDGELYKVKLYTYYNESIDISDLSSDIKIFDEYLIKTIENKFYELEYENEEMMSIENVFYYDDNIFNLNIKDICFGYILSDDGDLYVIDGYEYLSEDKVKVYLEKRFMDKKVIRFVPNSSLVELESGSYYDLEEEEYIDLSSIKFQFRNDAREILEEVIDIYSKDVYIDADNKIRFYNEILDKFEILDLNYNEIGKPYKILTSDWYYIDVINENNNIYRINIDEERDVDEYDEIENLGVINVDGIVKVINSFARYSNGEFIIVDNSGKVHKVFFDDGNYKYYIETINADNNIFIVDLITAEIYVDRDGYIHGYFYNDSEDQYNWCELELDLDDGELYELGENPNGNVISQFKEAKPLVFRDNNDVLHIKTDVCWDDWDDYNIENQFEDIGIKKMVTIDTDKWSRAWYIIVIDNNNDVWGFLQVASRFGL